MATARAINLRVRPLQSVDLCFQVDGVIGDQPEIHLLGKTVSKVDLPALYGTLGQTLPPGPGGASRLKFDSATIRSQLGSSVLYELRAESVKAALDKAIAQRENTFFQKFTDRANVIAQMKQAATDKATNLASLIQASKDQRGFLKQLYTTDFAGANFPNGVVKTTFSRTTNTSHPTTVSTTVGTGATPSVQSTKQNPGDDQVNIASGFSETFSRGYDYRHPGLENDAQFFRSQISLGDEQLAQFLSSRNRDFLDTVFDNDLAAMDLDIKRLQIAYIDTVLASPIDGVVTGVFRNKGDSVRAGQPVCRVENDEEVLLVGTVKYRGLISVGTKMTVTTKIFDSPTALSIPGSVVAVRGHDSEDEQWEVLILCGNRKGGKPILPINYNFDFDDTTIDVT
jgi:hypothetical protein